MARCKTTRRKRKQTNKQAKHNLFCSLFCFVFKAELEEEIIAHDFTYNLSSWDFFFYEKK